MIARRLIAPVLVAVAASVLLTACPGPPPAPTPTSTAPTPALPADVAFVVRGSFEAPGGGTTVESVMTVEAPSQQDAAEDAAAFASSTTCPPDAVLATSPAIADPAYLHVTVESRQSAGGYVSEAGVTFGSPGIATTWEGEVTTLDFCAPPLLNPIDGTLRGIGLVENGAVTGAGGWIPATGGYGMSVWDIAVPFTVTSCTIDLGPASAGTPVTDFVRVDASTGCTFGLLDSP